MKATILKRTLMAAALLATATLGAQTRIPAGTLMRSAADGQDTEGWQTVLHEDFSLFTTGTPDTPDTSKFYPEDYFETANKWMPDEMFHTTDWYGRGVCAAGGAIALAYPQEGMYFGDISTPYFESTGRLRVTLRYRVLTANSTFSLVFLKGSYDSPAPINAEMFDHLDHGGDVSDGWQEISYETTNTYTEPIFVQVNKNADTGIVVIDDLLIERDASYIAAPKGLAATDYTRDGFTLSWQGVENASSYLVDLYEKTTDGDGTRDEQVNIGGLFMDPEASEGKNWDKNGIYDSWWGNVNGLPEGWRGELSPKADSYYVSTEEYEGHPVIKLTDGDAFVFDAGDTNMLDMAFTVKAYNLPEGSHQIGIDFYLHKKSGKWDMAWYHASYYTDWATWHAKDIMGIDLSDYDQVAMVATGMSQYPDACIGVGALTSSTTCPMSKRLLKGDVAAAQTSVKFEGLDMDSEYSAVVTAVNAQGGKSEPSVELDCYGVATPWGLEASDYDTEAGTYLASWERTPHATRYEVEAYSMVTIHQDDTLTVFDEDFSPAEAEEGTMGTVLGNYETTSLDAYADNVGWRGNGNLVGDNALGCAEDEWGLFDYKLTSPAINLSNAGGKYTLEIEYEMEVSGAIPNLEVTTNNGDDLLFTGSSQREVRQMAGGTANTVFTFRSDMQSPFLIKRFTVKQDFAAGEVLVTTLGQYQVTDGETSVVIGNATPNGELAYGYSVKAIYERGKVVYTSEPSEICRLGTDVGIDEGAYEASGAVYYDLLGRRVATPAHGIYVKVSDGKVEKVRL